MRWLRHTVPGDKPLAIFLRTLKYFAGFSTYLTGIFVVNIVPRLLAGHLTNRGLIPDRGNKFISSKESRPTQSPPSLLFSEYRRIFPPDVKKLVRESDQLPHCSTEVKIQWTYTPHSFMCHHGVRRSNCAFVQIMIAVLLIVKIFYSMSIKAT
jgi:hypothetical protein